MTEKELKYRALFRSTGKHLFKDEPFPVSLKTHPVEFVNPFIRNASPVKVDWGYGLKKGSKIEIPYDMEGNPTPYEGFWEARCGGVPL
jgi:hypothetical protein